MGNKKKPDPRQARIRREIALARGELRGPTVPRRVSAGLTSMAIKEQDPFGIADQVERILVERQQQRQAQENQR